MPFLHRFPGIVVVHHRHLTHARTESPGSRILPGQDDPVGLVRITARPSRLVSHGFANPSRRQMVTTGFSHKRPATATPAATAPFRMSRSLETESQPPRPRP